MCGRTANSLVRCQPLGAAAVRSAATAASAVSACNSVTPGLSRAFGNIEWLPRRSIISAPISSSIIMYGA